MLQCVREGNLTVNPFGDKVSARAERDAYRLGDPLRENKDIVIIFAALCSRAAIEGGLSPRTAKALEVTYVRAAEQCTRTTDLISLNANMLQDFIRRVHASRNNPAVTIPVQECMEYIQSHLTEPFTLADLARHVGYTEYYLTKKISKRNRRETGGLYPQHPSGTGASDAGNNAAQRIADQRAVLFRHTQLFQHRICPPLRPKSRPVPRPSHRFGGKGETK